MYLKHVPSDELVEVLDLQDVINPAATSVLARSYKNDQQQKAAYYPKEELIFPSGESLPACWTGNAFLGRAVA